MTVRATPARSPVLRPVQTARVDAAYLQVMYALSNVCMHPAVNYVIFSYVISTCVVLLSGGVWHKHFGHLLLLEVQ